MIIFWDHFDMMECWVLVLPILNLNLLPYLTQYMEPTSLLLSLTYTIVYMKIYLKMTMEIFLRYSNTAE